MAVTLTVEQLAAALRLGDSTEETAEVTRLLGYCSEAVIKHAPLASDPAHTEACVRLAGYLYDQPFSGRSLSFAHGLRNSGAASILLPYRVHRAGNVSGNLAAAQSVGSADNPVVNVDISGSVLTVTFADGSTQTHDLPAGGGSGEDATARAAAAQAQADADTAGTAAGTAQASSTAVSNSLAAHEADTTTAHGLAAVLSRIGGLESAPAGGGGSSAPSLVGNYTFNISDGNFANTALVIPTGAAYLYIYANNFEWDHDNQAIDRTYERSSLSILDIDALITSVDRSAGDAVVTNPQAATDDHRGMVGRLGNFEMQFGSTAARVLLMGSNSASSNSVISGTLVVKAG